MQEEKLEELQRKVDVKVDEVIGDMSDALMQLTDDILFMGLVSDEEVLDVFKNLGSNDQALAAMTESLQESVIRFFDKYKEEFHKSYVEELKKISLN